MRSKHYRSRMYGALGAVALGVGAMGVFAAPGAVAADPAPIGPNQSFQGQVNTVSVGAVIKVLCPGPVSPTATGHPVGGQTVDVVAGPFSGTSNVGYTGQSANHVLVQFGTAVSVTQAVTLSAYDTKVAIPASLDLPCYGAGKVDFVPVPTSATAVTSTIPVTYVNVGLTAAP